MKFYSQKDSRWSNKTYYNGFSFGTYGCFVVSLAMFCNKEPIETAKILRDNNCFDSQGFLKSICASKSLGLDYDGKTTVWQNDICIAETNDYKDKGYNQHFFIWLGDGHIIDPLLGYKTVNNYNIVSFRLFRPKNGQGETMSQPEWQKAGFQSFEVWQIEHKKNINDRLFRVFEDRDGSQDELDNWAAVSDQFDEVAKQYKASIADKLLADVKAHIAQKEELSKRLLECSTTNEKLIKEANYAIEQRNGLQSELDGKNKELEKSLTAMKNLEDEIKKLNNALSAALDNENLNGWQLISMGINKLFRR